MTTPDSADEILKDYGRWASLASFPNEADKYTTFSNAKAQLCQALIARLPGKRLRGYGDDPIAYGFNNGISEAEKVIREYFGQEGK